MNSTPRRYLRALPSETEGQPERRFESPRRIGSAAPEPMPDHLRDEMWQAAELWQELHEEGKRLQYELDEATGRVTAELRDLDGSSRRPVALSQALGASDDNWPAA